MAKLPQEVSFLLNKLYDDEIETLSIGRLQSGDLGGLILFGYYNPKYKDVLPFWDAIPLVILLRLNGKYASGLNTHFIPYIYRINFVKRIYANYEKHKKLTWEDIKDAWHGADIPTAYAYFSYRTYLISRIATKIKVFGNENWKPAVSNILPKMNKMQDAMIYTYIMSEIKRRKKGKKLHRKAKHNKF